MASRRKSAFTLIEVIIVIIIIAVASSVAVPAYAHLWARTRFNAMTMQVKDMFAYAREQAISRDTTAVVTFEPQSARVVVNVMPSPPQADQPLAFGAGSGPDVSEAAAVPEPKTLSLGDEVVLSNFTAGAGNGPTGVRFHSDGTADGATVTLMSASGYSARLIVMPGTGRVLVESGTDQ